MSDVVRTEKLTRTIDWAVKLPSVIAELDKAREGALTEAAKLGIDTSYDDCVDVIIHDDYLVFRIKVPGRAAPVGTTWTEYGYRFVDGGRRNGQVIPHGVQYGPEERQPELLTEINSRPVEQVMRTVTAGEWFPV